MIKYVLAALVALVLLGLVASGFTPKVQQHVLFEGERWKLVEDFSTRQVCLIDKTEVEPPSCKPMAPGNTPELPPPTDVPPIDAPPVPATLPDEP